jgi:hypothetical protein
MSDPRLAAILEVVQEDTGNRGLRSDPADNLITRTACDFEAACHSIARHPMPSLAVVTGFWIATGQPPAHETDGPLGALFLARALVPLGIRVMLDTDSACRRAMQAGVEACGPPLAGVEVLTLPPPTHPWDVWLQLDWQSYARRIGLTHLIAVERVGPSHLDGRCYSMRGRDLTDVTPPAHALFEEKRSLIPEVTTIGIGDGGNEIGMGKIPREVIARNIPNGDRIACRVATDYLIVAGVSNWGAYALAAGVRLLRGAPHDAALFDPDVERRLLEVMVERGPLVDGVTGRPEATVDGLPFERHAEVLRKIAGAMR